MPGQLIDHTYLVGFSEGGLITTLAVEQYPQVFTGGLAACGPIGDFRKQVNYWGDFRVVFDYFFPGLLPPSAIDIPNELIQGWTGFYQPAVLAALANPGNLSAVKQLLKVTKAPFDPAVPATIGETVTGVLWYNVYATYDGKAKLGGNPFDNRRTWYFGSLNDRALNLKVQRFTADSAALLEMKKYQTSGKLQSQLVTLHTTGDPIVPYWHVPLYRLKVWQNWTGWNFSNIPIVRYGHCKFQVSEVLAGFMLLVWKATGELPSGLLSQLPTAELQADYFKLAQTYGIGKLDNGGQVIPPDNNWSRIGPKQP